MSNSISPKVLTLEEVRERAKRDAYVLWPYREQVEEGQVLYVDDSQVHLIWLEGYRSRNDSVRFEDILSVHDKKGPEVHLSPFRGKGYLTEAGVRWLESHPEQEPSHAA